MLKSGAMIKYILHFGLKDALLLWLVKKKNRKQFC